MNLRQLRRATKSEGKNLAKRLRAAGWSAVGWEAAVREDPVMRGDGEPWIALEYLRRWERRHGRR